MAKTAAFFDLDLTLLDVNSAVLWAQHEQERGFITRGQMAQAMLWTGLYYLSVIDMEKAYQQAAAYYRGLPQADLNQRTRDWFFSTIARRVRPGALPAVRLHQAQGQPVILLTSSSCFQAAAAAEAWGFDGWIANAFPCDDDGNLVGHVTTPLVYGQGKVTHAEAYAAREGIDLDRSYFYSDSYSDLPMLERVGRPRVVAPDPRLRLAAYQRRWPVLNWG